MMLIFWVVTVIHLSTFLRGANGIVKQTWSEKTLIKDLLHDYEKRARPVVDGVSKSVQVGKLMVQQINVEFGLGLIQILQLDENEQILTVSVKSLYRWPDYHLVWNPEEYENITQINIPTSKIWTPDIALYNYADERLEELRECAATVTHDGTVEWHPMAIYKSTCKVKIKYFPYDQQNCSLQFSTWSHDNSRVNISLYEKGRLMKDYSPSPEWELINHSVDIRERSYVCCPERWTDMYFNIVIQRQPAYYNYILILPCFLLSSLTLVLFWLPPETPAKMVLGMNIFVAFFLLLLLLKNSIPSASSSFPLIGNYYCTNMTLVTVSTFLCLIVVNLHFRGDRQTDVPPWLRKLAIVHGARLLFVNVTPPPPAKSKTNNYNQSNQAVGPPKSLFGYFPPHTMPYGNATLPRLSQSMIYGSGGMARGCPEQELFPEGQQLSYPANFYPTMGFPPSDRNRMPYSPNADPNDGAVPYINPANGRFPYPRSNTNERNRSCAFCPACAGLAAAAAAGGLSDSDDPENIEGAPRQMPLPEDPTEDLAAVWTAAMTGALSRTKELGPRDTQLEDADENTDGSIPTQSRPNEPDLEAFLLECVRPNSTKRDVHVTNARWKVGSQQGLPQSPFYQFASPTCEEDEDDDASVEKWPSSRNVARPEIDGPVEETDSDDSANNGIWHPNESKKRPFACADPLLLKRVQNLKRDVTEIVRCLRFMQRKNEKKERVNKQIAEWRAVGMVLDRLFFVIYLCALGISIIVYFPRSGNEIDETP